MNSQAENVLPKTILLVEDNPSDIGLARRAFTKSGILLKSWLWCRMGKRH